MQNAMHTYVKIVYDVRPGVTRHQIVNWSEFFIVRRV